MAQPPPATVVSPEGATRRRRPGAVTVVAWLSVLQGLAALAFVGLVGAAAWHDPSALWAIGTILPVGGLAVLLGIGGAVVLVAAVGLLRLQPWAWTLVMATQCWLLTLAVYDYLSGDPDYLVMALGVMTVLLLNRREVRLAFEPVDGRSG